MYSSTYFGCHIIDQDSLVEKLILDGMIEGKQETRNSAHEIIYRYNWTINKRRITSTSRSSIRIGQKSMATQSTVEMKAHDRIELTMKMKAYMNTYINTNDEDERAYILMLIMKMNTYIDG